MDPLKAVMTLFVVERYYYSDFHECFEYSGIHCLKHYLLGSGLGPRLLYRPLCRLYSIEAYYMCV